MSLCQLLAKPHCIPKMGQVSIYSCRCSWCRWCTRPAHFSGVQFSFRKGSNQVKLERTFRLWPLCSTFSCICLNLARAWSNSKPKCFGKHWHRCPWDNKSGGAGSCEGPLVLAAPRRGGITRTENQPKFSPQKTPPPPTVWFLALSLHCGVASIFLNTFHYEFFQSSLEPHKALAHFFFMPHHGWGAKLCVALTRGCSHYIMTRDPTYLPGKLLRSGPTKEKECQGLPIPPWH